MNHPYSVTQRARGPSLLLVVEKSLLEPYSGSMLSSQPIDPGSIRNQVDLRLGLSWMHFSNCVIVCHECMSPHYHGPRMSYYKLERAYGMI